MQKNIESFPSQLLECISNLTTHKKIKKNISSILIIGQGGSSIGGLLLKDLLHKHIDVPIILNHGYVLPKWVCSETLIIASSYSGNTEETLTVVNASIKKGFFPVCICSGGKLSEIANKKKLTCFILPNGFEPREALAYSSD